MIVLALNKSTVVKKMVYICKPTNFIDRRVWVVRLKGNDFNARKLKTENLETLGRKSFFD